MIYTLNCQRTEMMPKRQAAAFNRHLSSDSNETMNGNVFRSTTNQLSSDSKFRTATMLNKLIVILVICLVGVTPIVLASNVRSTKSYDFKETDGSAPGFIMFNLDKIHPSEVFKIESPNRWVSVDTTGAVRVKEAWDYEQLGNEKTIDFWVIITSPNLNEPDRQRIIIHIKDVNDEEPYFINRPLPMQAVVQLNAPAGTPVFKLQARDPDTDHNLHYFLVRDRSGDRFEVDERSGEVRTKGNEKFILDKEYAIYVRAEDHNAPITDRQFQQTKEERLSIVGGKRPPQFYMQKYEATIPETQKKDSDIIELKAKSFADREIRYSLRAQGKGAGTFHIGSSSGIVKLAKDLDYEDLRQPKQYSLIVTAIEGSGGFSTSVELTIKVTDVNDNMPRFELPDYQAYNIDEDVPIGTKILSVHATDLDSGRNAEIVYSLNRDEFYIDEKGVIYSNKRLDADVNNTYLLTVQATDKGEPPLSGTATVRIYTENKNDEPPKFSQDVYTPNIDENAQGGTLVTTVIASDKDGDGILFGFVGGGTTSGMFHIEERTGVIRLINEKIHLDKDKYELNVTARDDGSCCRGGAQTSHTSSALVVVFITDVNDNKPIFSECASYSPQIEEGSPSNTHVVTVHADDIDKGLNGQVRYSIVQQPNQKGTKFIVDEVTGEIRSNKVFDREGEDGRFVSVTVKAIDRGTPPLEGVCSFKVEITDVNDNSPLFDRQEYKENIKQDTPIGTNILRVSASDEDSELSGSILYNLSATVDPSDVHYFHINQDSGWITLKRPLDKAQYQLRATAVDRGVPQHMATVEIVIDVVDRANNPPVWSQSVYGPIPVRENIEVGKRVISIKADSGIPENPTVFYTLIKGSTEQTNKLNTFYLTHRAEGNITWCDIFVNYALDYERIQQYNLTVRVENNGVQQLASEATVYIVLEDVNDEIPLFIEKVQETVLEGMPKGTKVTQVEAIDHDGTYPNSKVFYSIEPQPDGSDRFFSIDKESGEIYTKMEFDREEKQAYALLVRAYDGAPSDRPNMKPGQPNYVTKYIRIGIGDKNDNAPYFSQSLYEAEVNEDEDIQHTVITVTAKDKDESSKIRYEITEGNYRGAFAVKNETGAIYVAGPLDYETRKEYNLTLVASDTLHENTTIVRIKVIDCNDMIPVFEQQSYETTIMEEDDKGLPKRILQVTAKDGDVDRPQNIVYFLTGQGIEDKNPTKSKFSINSTTGEIYVLKPLDRDLPHGRSQWRFTVFAEDEGGNGLVGYADVLVNLKDINDNSPFFSSNLYVGNVTENGTAGMTVMTMTATDYDDPLEGSNAKLKYSIEQNQVNENGELIFAIDEETGVISTAVCCLDREQNPEYNIKIAAIDGGGLKGTGTATIKIKDINDQPPEFVKKEWFVEVDETDGDQIPDLPILVVSVNDGDLLETNRFSYKVADKQFGADKFTMVTNSADGTGSLKIAKPLDFEDPQQRYGFNITISVSDHGGESSDPYHVDYAKVNIRLRDVNDNVPDFERPNIEVSVAENSTIGTQLATFHATDVDAGGKSKVSYYIDRASDRKRQFKISPEGVVSIQRKLDRETAARHVLKIIGVDDGFPPKSSTATLTVVVTDINDNPPRFLYDYRPVIMEKSPPQKVQEILATDDDDRSKGNASPFFFAMSQDAPDYIKRLFTVQYDHRGSLGDGSAVVYSNASFDREQQKEYDIPILIRDNGNPSMSAVSILTVTIGDLNNNKMQPGSKTIFVYNLKGEQYSQIEAEIGRVHVEDKDDCDLPDKNFRWVDGYQKPEKFEVDYRTGIIRMKNITEGEHHLNFVVYDQKYSNEVNANVTVIVKEIPEEAVRNSGSIRVSGITAEGFVRVWDWKTQKQRPSMYEMFKNVLMNITRVRDKDNIDVFSVITKSFRPPVTDIRFSVHGSPYYKSVYLDGTVALNRDLFLEKIGLNITMVGIDECMNEGVCDGSCSNELVINNKPLMVNANRTAFVGIDVSVKANCLCNAKDFTKIETCHSGPFGSSPCLNGGQCVDTASGPLCKCAENYDGPHCEIISRSFTSGKGWAWFEPLQSISGQCEESHLSLEFMTKSADGLILYNGPIVRPDEGFQVEQDFISLELIKGYARLLIDFGSGTKELTIKPLGDLHNGEWHMVDIFWDRETVRMMIDRCVGVLNDNIQDASSSLNFDRSKCENKTDIQPFNEFLNVNTPLQLGGFMASTTSANLHHYFNWKYRPQSQGFVGCIKNVIHNSIMYDLGSPGSAIDSAIGCQPADDSCQANTITRNCGPEGQCVGSYSKAYCQCKPGWSGARCNKRTQSKMFHQSSYNKYALSFSPNTYRNEIQVMFRTREKSGELIRAMGSRSREHLVLEIKDKKLRFRYKLSGSKGNDERILTLPDVIVSDGQWHVALVKRYGSLATISLDGGSGRRYNEIMEFGDRVPQLIQVDKQNFFAGGEVQFVGPGITIVENDFQEGCMNDIRFDQKSIPMENGSENAAVVEWRNLVDGCPSNNPCHGRQCSRPFVCQDLWRSYECRCPAGFEMTENRLECRDKNECLWHPCGQKGKCVNLENGRTYQCECEGGYTCTNCTCDNLGQWGIGNSIAIGKDAWIAIILAILAYIILVMVIIIYSKSRRPGQKFGHGDIDDDVRENIINYADEGGGEDDMNAFDITPLRIPIDSNMMNKQTMIKDLRQRQFQPGEPQPDMAEFIKEHVEKASNDPSACPYDDLRKYAYEGCGSTTGSLSSLASAQEEPEQDVDWSGFLELYGPRFQKLKNLYHSNPANQ